MLSGLVVDFYIPSHNLALELDGPTHFSRGVDPQMLGPTAFKHRILKAAGYNVLSITLDRWVGFMDLKAQRAFLEPLIKRP